MAGIGRSLTMQADLAYQVILPKFHIHPPRASLLSHQEATNEYCFKAENFTWEASGIN
jgi:hypothetical protein